jgi:hypothetical protein
MSILILWLWSLAGVVDRGGQTRTVGDKPEASITLGYERVERPQVHGE